MRTLRQMLTTDWHLMRILRVVFGSFFLVQAFNMSDVLIGLAGALFLYQGITNTGCCGATCMNNMPLNKAENEEKEINYEEIK